jgi:hypothetical protein
VNANSIIGIDVQGETKEIDIRGNYVDVEDDIVVGSATFFGSLVIGENADDKGTNSTIRVAGNLLFPKITIQNKVIVRRNLRMMEQSTPTISTGIPSDETHSKIRRTSGGCLFSQ